jgi:hypothetical protein
VVNIATQDDDEPVSFQAKRFDRARGATIYTLNLPDELASHPSAANTALRRARSTRTPPPKQTGLPDDR